MGVPIINYRALLEALCGIEDGMARSLWSDSSSFDSKDRDHIDQERKEPLVHSDRGHLGLNMHLFCLPGFLCIEFSSV